MGRKESNQSNKQTKHMLRLMNKKIFTILPYAQIFCLSLDVTYDLLYFRVCSKMSSLWNFPVLSIQNIIVNLSDIFNINIQEGAFKKPDVSSYLYLNESVNAFKSNDLFHKV